MWTNEQQNAIDAPIGDIIVTAAAGSGKTAVMVERIIGRLTGENPVDADKILVVTFTNAAAAEIKARIMKQIIAEIDKGAGETLKRQLVLLNNADICTIHSFCLNVVRSNFNKLGIDPNVKIGKANDLELMRKKALDDVFEEHYENGDEVFLRLVRAYGGKSDAAVADMVSELSTFSKSLPDSKDWLNNLAVSAKHTAELIIPVVLDYAVKKCAEAVGIYDKIIKLCDLDSEFSDIVSFFELEKLPVEKARAAKTWAQLYNSLSDVNFATLRLSKKSNRALAETVKILREKAKNMVKNLMKTYVNTDETGAMSDIELQQPYVAKLSELALESDRKYAAAKKEKSLIDFSDFEHLCLAALRDGDKPSETALALSEKYEEIYIDEYQDCNSVQEEIFKLISGTHTGRPNIFAVGDMKQSIYKFRDADPKLFKAKCDTYPEYDSAERKPQSKISLSMNFRSRAEVLSCVNSVFAQVMSEDMGELEYGESEQLRFGSTCYTETIDDNKCTDVVLIEKGGSARSDEDPEETGDEKREYGREYAEAVYAAGRIKEMMADPEYRVFDKKLNAYRHIEYRDIVILMRSANSHSAAYSDVFGAAGIPVFTDVGGYFGSREIDFLINVLKITDNPLDDIPLAAVMRHPVIGFGDNELAQIRLSNKKGGFYDALCAESEHGGDLGEKCRNFAQLLGRLYDESKYKSVAEILRDVIAATDYMTYLCTLGDAEKATANVRMLFHKADEFESNNFKGIFNFVNYIESIRQKTKDSDSAKVIGENDNVVRVMTIHKSKGLEFPVVFLSRTGSKFNDRDINAKMLLHKQYGIGINIADPDRGITYPSLAKNALKLVMKREMLSEELRILYVAMTRAREKLIITAYCDDFTKKIESIEQLIAGEEYKISPDSASAVTSYIDWVLLSVLRNKSCTFAHDDFAGGSFDDGSNFTCIRVSENSLTIDEDKSNTENFGIDICDTDSEVERRMSFVYPHENMISVPRNISVTELKRMAMEEDETVHKLYPTGLSAPSFLSESKALSGAQRGTLVHFIMEKLDFRNADENGIKEQLDKMLSDNLLTKAEYNSVDIARVAQFAASELGVQILRHYDSFEREFAFKYTVSANEIYPDADDSDCIIVQGVIDAFFENDDGEVVIIDYKTDRIISSPEETAAKYKAQLKYYSEALEKLLEKRVSSCYIYLFESGNIIKI